MEQAVTQGGSTAAPDPFPLLPHGQVVFDDLPMAAVVIEALAPAIGHGQLVVRSRQHGAVILVRDGQPVEVHTVAGGTPAGGVAVADVQGWSDALVSAQRLDPAMVNVCESLLRGEIIHTDLRLEWVDWTALLADFVRRGGAYAIEIVTPVGRGVTCVAGGAQVLSYTDVHPVLGDPALVGAMAASKEGTIQVRLLDAAAFLPNTGAPTADPQAEASQPPNETPEPVVAADDGHAEAAVPEPVTDAADEAPNPVGASEGPDTRPASVDSGDETDAVDSSAHVEAESAQAADETSSEAGTHDDPGAGHANGAGAGHESGFAADSEATAEQYESLPDITQSTTPAEPAPAEPVGGNPDLAGTGITASPSAPTVYEVLGDLRGIARRRLQLAASPVQALLDDGARQGRPVDAILREIRQMSIRGVMPTTIEAMVSEMSSAVAARRSV